MRRRDNRGPEAEARAPYHSWRERSDRELIAAMRANVSPAFDEFVARYQPLLLARTGRSGLPEWQREECVTEVLESAILRVMKPGVQPPAEMAAYLTRTLHNRLVDVARAQGTRAQREHAAVDRSAPALERAVTSLASQHAVESCTADRYAPSPDLPPALARLSEALIKQMTEEERALISWEGNMIPHRTIALWLGISHAAATKRVWRLRARLREVAARHAQSLNAAEREEIDQLMHRSVKCGKNAMYSPAKVAEATGPPYRNAEPGKASRTIEDEIDE